VRLLKGDCREQLKLLPDESVDSIVTDPPYELGFMGKSWDASGIAYNVEVWRECLRVLKPGGHLLAFGGSRTYHRLACAVEDAGFEIRDQIMWVYGSGFPKSLDVGKAIDKRGGVVPWQKEFAEHLRSIKPKSLTANEINAVISQTKSNFWGHFIDTRSQPLLPTIEQYQRLKTILPIDPIWDAMFLPSAQREIIGQKTSGIANKEETDRHTIGASKAVVVDVTAPATDLAKRWDGWGTALKPAHEPVVVARKPLVGTVAQNVLRYGTGAINIDATRIPGEVPSVPMAEWSQSGTTGASAQRSGEMSKPHDLGRWPANFIHDGSHEVLELFPETKPETSAARFFYCAKASKAERNAGLEHLPQQQAGIKNSSGRGFSESDPHREILRHNHHPTVKPIDLMRYLIRLVTPPNGTVLDPFAGSGTTLVAAIHEHMNPIGIELTEEYWPIIEARTDHARNKT
jgi:DNA modification methylase